MGIVKNDYIYILFLIRFKGIRLPACWEASSNILGRTRDSQILKKWKVIHNSNFRHPLGKIDTIPLVWVSFCWCEHYESCAAICVQLRDHDVGTSSWHAVSWCQEWSAQIISTHGWHNSQIILRQHDSSSLQWVQSMTWCHNSSRK